jgi:hypothetical protein
MAWKSARPETGPRDQPRNLNCGLAQGYWIVKRMPADRFFAWVREWRPPEPVEAPSSHPTHPAIAAQV